MTEESAEHEDELLIRGKRIPVLVKEIPQLQLRFYLENPRLYSLVRSDGDEPTEEDCFKWTTSSSWSMPFT
jgi:hypothetical protein